MCAVSPPQDVFESLNDKTDASESQAWTGGPQDRLGHSHRKPHVRREPGEVVGLVSSLPRPTDTRCFALDLSQGVALGCHDAIHSEVHGAAQVGNAAIALQGPDRRKGLRESRPVRQCKDGSYDFKFRISTVLADPRGGREVAVQERDRASDREVHRLIDSHRDLGWARQQGLRHRWPSVLSKHPLHVRGDRHVGDNTARVDATAGRDTHPAHDSSNGAQDRPRCAREVIAPFIYFRGRPSELTIAKRRNGGVKPGGRKSSVHSL